MAINRTTLPQQRHSHGDLIAPDLDPREIDQVSPDFALAQAAAFNAHIHGAALFVGAALHEAGIDSIKFSKAGSHGRERGSRQSWYRALVEDSLAVSRYVQEALVSNLTPFPRSEKLVDDAFDLLSELSPARVQLVQLRRYDRARAFTELAKHVAIATDQFRLSTELVAEVSISLPRAEQSDQQRFADLSAALLDRAGGGVSLTEGAALLGITRQALHKRVKSGSALGMMQGDELVLPKFQFVSEGGKVRLVKGLADVVGQFDKSGAGRWSALQFLIDGDPNLAGSPISALAEGRIEEVASAARAYLDSDED